MPMSNSLISFKESLTRIRDIINDVNANAAKVLKDAAVRARNETIRCATMVILSGFFESFLRTAADEYIAELCSTSLPFNNLPDRSRAARYMGGEKLLLKRVEKDKRRKPIPRPRA